MDFLHESIALSVDVLFFGLFLRGYHSYKSTLAALKDAPQLNIDKNLKEKIESSDQKTIPYAAIRGTVVPIGQPVRSITTSSVTGVVQVLKLYEHRVARGFAGFWTEHKKLFHISTNEVPFRIVNNDVDIEIVDALSSEILDLELIHDAYEPSNLSFFDHIFGFFSGIRSRGIQTTEEMLRDGSFITAIGELESNSNGIRLRPSKVGPMFLTTATKGTLIRRFEEAKSAMLTKVIVCGAIAGILTGIILRKIYLRKKHERMERKLKEQLEQARRQRRQQARTNDLIEQFKCVVCVENPKEIICLPCGHVCLCEDCSAKIQSKCPICRTRIETKAVAFLS